MNTARCIPLILSFLGREWNEILLEFSLQPVFPATGETHDQRVWFLCFQTVLEIFALVAHHAISFLTTN